MSDLYVRHSYRLITIFRLNYFKSRRLRDVNGTNWFVQLLIGFNLPIYNSQSICTNNRGQCCSVNVQSSGHYNRINPAGVIWMQKRNGGHEILVPLRIVRFEFRRSHISK